MMLLFAALLAGVLAPSAQDNAVQPVKPMARDADPSFEVATVKPSAPNDTNQSFGLKGHVIAVESNTVSTIICFAYEIHKKTDRQCW
jgi:hypothetical protein